MKNKLVKLVFGNLLVKGSLIVFFTSIFSSAGTYFFHLFIGRMLGPVDYGILESLIAILYYLGIPLSVMSVVIIKFVSQNSSNLKLVSKFTTAVIRKFSYFGLFISISALCFYPLVNRAIRINSFFLFFLIIVSSFLGIYQLIFSSCLQGLLKFEKTSLLNIVSNWGKLIASLFLVFLGFKVWGAVCGLIISILVVIIMGYQMLKKYLVLNIFGETGNFHEYFNNLGKYSFSVLLSNLSLTSIYSTDIILARTFLTPVDAGKYAALSVLGKIIFFSSNPLVSVLFPIVSEKNAKGEDCRKLLLFSIGVITVISFIISCIYKLFPETMVKILYGSAYLGISGELFLFSIFISLYSVCSLLINFFLSISKNKIFIFPIFGSILQAALIIFFHQSIRQMITVNIITVILLFFALLLYYFHYGHKTRFSFRNCSGI